MMNKKKWNSLPADIQDAIWSVSGDAGSKLYGQGDDITSKIIMDDIRASGGEIIILKPQEQEQWNALTKQIQDEIINGLEAKGLPARKVWNEVLRLVKEYKK
jgi:TRAP-type C4-dicarboxylate transport system substrate-binding protein